MSHGQVCCCQPVLEVLYLGQGLLPHHQLLHLALRYHQSLLGFIVLRQLPRKRILPLSLLLLESLEVRDLGAVPTQF